MAQSSNRTIEVRGLTSDLASMSLTQLPAAPLMSLDLKFETLRVTVPQGFLDNVVQAVNQHAQVIKLVATEMKTKVNVVEVTEAFTIVSSGVPGLLFDRPPAADLSSVRETANRAAQGVNSLGKHVLRLKEFEETTNQRLNDFQRELDSKATIEQVKAKVKKAKKKVEDHLERRYKELNTAMQNLQTVLMDKVAQQDKKISDVEVNTLWKLKDVEELLKTRVNEKFVWDAINATLGKGKKDLKDLSAELNSKLEKLTKELQDRIERVETTDRDSTSHLQQLIDHLEDRYPLLSLSHKIGQDEFQRLLDELNELKDSADLRLKLEELMLRIDKLTQKVNSLGDNDQLKKEVEWLGEELKRLAQRINQVQEDLAKKVDMDKFREAIAALKSETPKGPTGPSVDPSDFANVKDRLIDMIKALEKKFEKLARSLDLKGILSQLELKANSQQVNTDLGDHSSKLGSHEQAINDLEKDLESLKVTLQKIVSMVQDAHVTSNSLVSRRPLGSSTCLSCGRGEAKFAPMLPAVMGSDGRVYRADGNLMKVQSIPGMELDPMYDVGSEVFSIDTHEQAHYRIIEEGVTAAKQSNQASPRQVRSQTFRAPLNVILGTARSERKITNVKIRPQSAKK